MTIINTIEHVVCDDCGHRWQAAVTADLACVCGSANLTVTEDAEVPAWLNLDAVISPALRARVAFKGNHAVTDSIAIDGHDRDEVLRLAAAAEANSEQRTPDRPRHHGRDTGPQSHPPRRRLRALPGRGVTGTVDAHTVAVGGPPCSSTSASVNGRARGDDHAVASPRQRRTLHRRRPPGRRRAHRRRRDPPRIE